MVSFDVFGTLITRSTYTPHGIFQLVEDQLKMSERGNSFPAFLVNNFVRLRIDAEMDAKRIDIKRCSESITINEIYESFRRMTGVSKSVIQKISELEIETEIKNIRGLRQNIALLKKYIENGENVILISDMYLPSVIMRRLLMEVDPELIKIPLFISCEMGKKKSTGDLYVYIKEKMNIPFEQWIHYGDNYHSDIKMAALWGIHAIQILPDKRILEKVDRFGKSFNINMQLFLGVLNNLCADNELNDIQFLGAYWGGGILYSYVAWVLQYSLIHHYKRLYFIARDGYILKKIADNIIEANQYDIQTKYIYGSRKAWRDLDSDSQKMVKSYFQQEIDYSDNCFALVDLQGIGYTVMQLANYIQDIFADKLNVFFYHMYSCEDINGCNFIYYGYVQSVQLLELFARAPHGVTVGYRRENGKVLPVLAESDMDKWRSCGLLDYIKGIDVFSKAYTFALKKNGYIGIDYNLSDFIISDYDVGLNEKEMAFISQIPHSSSLDNNEIAVAPTLSRKDIFNLYMWRTVEELSDYYQGDDLNLSLRRLNVKDQKYKQFLEKNYYSFYGRILHWSKHLTTDKIKLECNKIIIYAAGFMGARLYNFITYNTTGKVVGWTDSDYYKYCEKGYPLTSLNICLKKKYDIVIVALENRISCKEIINKLIFLGVDPKRIKSLEEFGRDLGEKRPWYIRKEIS